jgi:hypothetical protein
MEQRCVRRHRFYPTSWYLGWLAIRCRTLVAAMAIFAGTSAAADAHVAPSGWAYPYQCCRDRDCRPVHNREVMEGPNGYVIAETGEVVGYGDPRLRNSPDGEFHLCAVPGTPSTKAICLFVPPRSF